MWSLCYAKKYFGIDSYRLPPQDEKKTNSLPYLASEHRFLEFGISIEFHTPISFQQLFIYLFTVLLLFSVMFD